MKRLPFSLVRVWGLAAVAILAFPPLSAADIPEKTEPTAEQIEAFRQHVAATLAKLQPQSGPVVLGAGLATLQVPEHLQYLDPAGTQVVLEQLWGNPQGGGTLGMLIPGVDQLMGEGSWGVIFTYEDSGHVKDDDAAGIDYAKLLQEMREGTAEANRQRAKLGFPAINLLGWAAPPHYDATTKKLYWAKELRFDGETETTLNYNIRVLGREGVLNLNAVASMAQLAQIEADVPAILAAAEFNPGHRYADFDPATDRVAEYGIAALIAGGVAAKTGLLKAIWLAILAGKKFVIIGVVALGAGLVKLFSGRRKHAFDTAQPPPPPAA